MEHEAIIGYLVAGLAGMISSHLIYESGYRAGFRLGVFNGKHSISFVDRERIAREWIDRHGDPRG